MNKDKRIVGIGYNERDADDDGPFIRDAEDSAILNKTSDDVKGCTLYTTLFPCKKCAKSIIKSEIGKVVYLSDSKKEQQDTIDSKELLNSANIPCLPFEKELSEISFKLDP